MIESSCHCGAVRLEIAYAPREVTDCNCSICRRYGVLWAYYPLADVKVPATGVSEIYMWGDQSIEFHRCRICGCVSHWYPRDDTRGRMGINARLLAPELLQDVRIRHLDGAVTEQYID
ncbi:MAG TPA: GFA family protein [Dongiaceae bacterium]|nr:GFA family protein [Dongiaceae bacterium]